MKFFAVIILLLAPINDLNKIAKANETKKAAREAYASGDFEKAAQLYQYLIDSIGVENENILLNLGNSLYKIQDSLGARNTYNRIIDQFPENRRSNSLAHQQLGQMDYSAKQYEPALDQYKNALRADPTNEDARYNYELLKKILEKQEQEQEQQNQDQQDQQEQNEDQNQDQQNQDQQQQNQDQENQDQQSEQQQDQEQQQNQEEGQEKEQQEQDGESEESEEKEQEQPQEGEEDEESAEQEPSLADKLEEMNISEEKAKMILEAMKNNEIQYLQQNRRKAKRKKDSGKPDW